MTSKIESNLDFLLAVSYALICTFSLYRLKESLDIPGGRTVIKIFYTLIFFASCSRTVWFFIPNEYLEESYAPEALIAYRSKNWLGTLISELFLSFGSLSLYSIFILIACYWLFIIKRLELAPISVPPANIAPFTSHVNPSPSIKESFLQKYNLGTIELFEIIISFLFILQTISIILYLTQVWNSEEMILYDSLMLSLVALPVMIIMLLLSSNIHQIFSNIESINQSSNAQPQMKRINAITYVALLFFVTRVFIEWSMAGTLIYLMRSNHSYSVLIKEPYWSIYIAFKHGAEIIVLSLELIVSTAMKTYTTQQRLPPRRIIPGNIQRSSLGGSALERAYFNSHRPSSDIQTTQDIEEPSSKIIPLVSLRLPPRHSPNLTVTIQDTELSPINKPTSSPTVITSSSPSAAFSSWFNYFGSNRQDSIRNNEESAPMIAERDITSYNSTDNTKEV